MKRFYVYEVNGHFEFVEDVESFARTLESAAFTGIAIEANSEADAAEVFGKPTSDIGEYMLVDEPSATVYRKALLDLCQSIKNFDKELLIAKTKEIIIRLAPINVAISGLARDTYRLYGHPEKMTEEMIYNMIRQNMCEIWMAQFCYIKDGDTKES